MFDIAAIEAQYGDRASTVEIKELYPEATDLQIRRYMKNMGWVSKPCRVEGKVLRKWCKEDIRLNQDSSFYSIVELAMKQGRSVDEIESIVEILKSYKAGADEWVVSSEYEAIRKQVTNWVDDYVEYKKSNMGVKVNRNLQKLLRAMFFTVCIENEFPQYQDKPTYLSQAEERDRLLKWWSTYDTDVFEFGNFHGSTGTETTDIPTLVCYMLRWIIDPRGYGLMFNEYIPARIKLPLLNRSYAYTEAEGLTCTTEESYNAEAANT